MASGASMTFGDIGIAFYGECDELRAAMGNYDTVPTRKAAPPSSQKPPTWRTTRDAGGRAEQGGRIVTGKGTAPCVG